MTFPKITGLVLADGQIVPLEPNSQGTLIPQWDRTYPPLVSAVVLVNPGPPGPTRTEWTNPDGTITPLEQAEDGGLRRVPAERLAQREAADAWTKAHRYAFELPPEPRPMAATVHGNKGEE